MKKSILEKRWKILFEESNSKREILDIILANRKIKNKEEFLNIKNPNKYSLSDIGVDKKEFEKAKKRIIKSKTNKELVLIYGDYDADGVSGSAILWEGLSQFGMNVWPYIPDRFKEGYGVRAEKVEDIQKEKGKIGLVICIDNGITRWEEIEKLKKIGIDTIIIDHHEKDKKLPECISIFHSTITSGSVLAYFFIKELLKKEFLDLAVIGLVGDQIELKGINRSIAEYGIKSLRKTSRQGILELISESKIKKEEIGIYEIGFVIAPRLNSMGRLKHAIDSLRLLCIKSKNKANTLAKLIGETNTYRQNLIKDTILGVKKSLDIKNKKIIIIKSKNYHEGIIGLAASDIVKEYNLPAVVMSVKNNIIKASARSIPGFDITKAIKNTKLILEGGGHNQAAGFTLKKENYKKFKQKLEAIADKNITKEQIEKKIIIDCILEEKDINIKLISKINLLAPFGPGNYEPVFVSKDVKIKKLSLVGKLKNHLKFKGIIGNTEINCIAFNLGHVNGKILHEDAIIDIAYYLKINSWNNKISIDCHIKDIKI